MVGRYFFSATSLRIRRVVRRIEELSPPPGVDRATFFLTRTRPRRRMRGTGE
jgi:hypothetical protein